MGERRRLGPPGHAELAQHARDVGVDRLRAMNNSAAMAALVRPAAISRRISNSARSGRCHAPDRAAVRPAQATPVVALSGRTVPAFPPSSPAVRPRAAPPAATPRPTAARPLPAGVAARQVPRPTGTGNTPDATGRPWPATPRRPLAASGSVTASSRVDSAAMSGRHAASRASACRLLVRTVRSTMSMSARARPRGQPR